MNDNTTDTQATKEASPTANFLTQLGMALLKEKRRDWMDMCDVADFCAAQEILLDGICPTPDQLEAALREFFLLAGEFYAPGVAVDGYDRRVGWDRVFMIRAYPYSFTHQSSTNGFNGVADPAPLTTCDD